jgi:hypothetical protein
MKLVFRYFELVSGLKDFFCKSCFVGGYCGINISHFGINFLSYRICLVPFRYLSLLPTGVNTKVTTCSLCWKCFPERLGWIVLLNSVLISSIHIFFLSLLPKNVGHMKICSLDP